MSLTSPPLHTFLPGATWREDPIRVLLCDDHDLYRRGLVVTLESEPDLEVVGEAAKGTDAHHLAGELAPDLVLIDIGLPPYGGVATAAQISQRVPTVPILLLTANDRDLEELLEGIGAGAMGYAIKEDTLEQGGRIVRRAAEREAVIPPVLAEGLGRLVKTLDAGSRVPLHITGSERALVEALAGGADTAEAAVALGLDPATARNQLTNVVLKLQRYWRQDEAIQSLGIRRPQDQRAGVAAAVKRIAAELG